MMKLVVALLVLIFPVVLHGLSMLGRSILDPIQSPSNALNRLFNSHPLALSISAGIFAAAAFLLTDGAAFYVCIGIAAACFLVDVYATLLSFLSYISNKR